MNNAADIAAANLVKSFMLFDDWKIQKESSGMTSGGKNRSGEKVHSQVFVNYHGKYNNIYPSFQIIFAQKVQNILSLCREFEAAFASHGSIINIVQKMQDIVHD